MIPPKRRETRGLFRLLALLIALSGLVAVGVFGWSAIAHRRWDDAKLAMGGFVICISFGQLAWYRWRTLRVF